MKRTLFIVTLSLSVLTGCNYLNSDKESDLTSENNSLASVNTFDEEEWCPAGSFYDEIEDGCYVECEDLSDEECENLENEVFGDFDEFYVDDYDGYNNDDESESIAQYAIEADLTLSELENNEPDSESLFQDIWSDAKRILPLQWVKNSFSEFHINTDGEDGTLAYVQADEFNTGKWIIAFDDLDYAGLDDKEFIHTVIHEFGHVVFLGEGQLNTEEVDQCDNYLVDEGCANSSSHINRFFQSFWTDIINENKAIETDEDQLIEFYEKYQNRFVSEYAATNPVEDAAEVFTNFVLREKPIDTSTIANQKIAFMHTVEPLVQLRKQIRRKLSIVRRNRIKR